jgi:glycosyltransferase involved in cell wall biosynthesis
MTPLAAAADADLSALVQSDAVGELPAGVRPRVRPSAAGARRAALGLLPLRGADLVHGLDVDLPVLASAATVSTVHDLSVFDTPGAFSARRARGERWLVGRAVRRADALVAVSAFTAERVQQLFGRSCVVVPLAPAARMVPPAEADLARARARYELPERFVLHVGTIEPRKDVPRLAAAAARLQVPLLLAGALASGQSVPAGARHLGYVPTEDLPALYAAATVVAYCSHYEGFGLPPLEAMACGAAVLASRVGALPETLGDAASLVPPRDDAAIEAALGALLADEGLRAERRAAGLARAARFSWQRAAEQTVQVYRDLGVAC